MSKSIEHRYVKADPEFPVLATGWFPDSYIVSDPKSSESWLIAERNTYSPEVSWVVFYFPDGDHTQENVVGKDFPSLDEALRAVVIL